MQMPLMMGSREGGNLGPDSVLRSYLEPSVRTDLTAAQNAIPLSQKGAAGGVATLDGSGRVPSSQVPQVISNTAAAPPGYVILDSFDGATDDAKLANAMSYAAAQTFPPVIMYGNREYTHSVGINTYDGFRIMGPVGYSNAEKGRVNSVNRINLSIGGGNPWLNSGLTSGARFDVSIMNLAFRGGSTSGLVRSTTNSSGQFYCMMIRDISTSGLQYVLGGGGTKLLLTAAQFDGYWELNNSTERIGWIGGSDNTFWPAGGLMDSPASLGSAAASYGYHLFFDYCEKSTVGPLYMTAEGGWSGIRVDGPAYNTDAGNTGAPMIFTGLRLEGRNSGAPCNGSLFRSDGGAAVLRDCWTSYAMAAPPSGHDGVIDVQGSGMVVLDGTCYDTADVVPETLPYVHVASGYARVSNVLISAKGGVWTGKPRVTNLAATANVVVDNSVTGSNTTAM